MEHNHDTEMDNKFIDLPKLGDFIEEKINQTINPSELKKVFTDLNLDSNLSDAFYKSIKGMFDEGLKLANSIDLDFLLDTGKILQKKEETQKEK